MITALSKTGQTFAGWVEFEVVDSHETIRGLWINLTGFTPEDGYVLVQTHNSRINKGTRYLQNPDTKLFHPYGGDSHG